MRGREGRGEGREGRPESVPLFSLLELATLTNDDDDDGR